MSHIRKHVTAEITTNYPVLSKDTEKIVRVVATRGTNQVEVEACDGEKMLVMMPTKFRKLIWIKRGDYLIIDTDLSEENTGKIKGIIEHVLQTQHIKHLKKMNMWPEQFQQSASENAKQSNGNNNNEEDDEVVASSGDERRNDEDDEEYDSEEEEEDDEYFVNPNHRAPQDSSDDEDEDDDN
eukprot:GEZU01013751.1.p1 GENE.GEZU01013751.1~~GEZU01013751.1.p1  ORF type:complete len:182 (+),score=65.77 GEZU01013751.1:95-640(+)